MRIFLMGMLLLLLHDHGIAQNDTSQAEKLDFIKIGNIYIIKSSTESNQVKKFGKDSSLILSTKGAVFENEMRKIIDLKKRIDTGFRTVKNELNKKKSKNYSTNWFIWDLGFTRFLDRSGYMDVYGERFFQRVPGMNVPPISYRDFTIKTRISNFNIWFFMQRMNLIEHAVNLKYGLGIESLNYFYNSNIKFEVESSEPYLRRVSGKVSKNKLVTNYLTVPIMINLNTNPSDYKNGLQFSFGVSGGILFSSWQKMKIDGKISKQHSEFNLTPFKFSYIAELGLGKVKLYANYEDAGVFSSSLYHYTYNVGIRFSN